MDKETFAGYVKEFDRMVRWAILEVIPGLNYNFLDDLVQETWAKAWEIRESYDSDKAKAQTWLTTIATSVAIDYLRAEGAQKRPTLVMSASAGEDEDGCDIPYYEAQLPVSEFGSNVMPPHAPSAEEESVALQRSRDMRRRVDLLAQRERDILSLAYDQDYSAREIADELRLNYDNVRQIMARSRKFVTRG